MGRLAKPDRDQLVRLADMKVAEGLVISVYVDLDPSRFATPPARSNALASIADEAGRAVEQRSDGLPHDARIALRKDVERIRAYCKSADFDGTHGLAVFAAGCIDFFEAIHLPHRVESAVVLDDAPHMTPLALRPTDCWCVLLVNRRDARVLHGSAEEGFEEDARISDDVPGRHDQGGYSQARYQRHIDEEARRHFKRVAKEVAQRLRRRPFDHLLVGGPEEGYSEFVEMLDPHLRELLRGRVTLDIDSATVSEITDAAIPLMEDYEESRRRDLLSSFRAGLGSSGLAAAGIEDVLGCLNERRVQALLLDSNLSAPGAECPSCRLVVAAPEGECPVDGATLQPRDDVVEAAVERALEQDAGVIRFPAPSPEMEAHGGVGALLRF